MYEYRAGERIRDERYRQLKERNTKIVSLTSAWINEATNLHTESAVQEEKDDIIALRDAFILALRTELGV